jgi:hypothetical protein
MRASPYFNVPLSVEFTRGLETIHRLRLDDVAPLLPSPPDVVAELTRRRKEESHFTLGHLYTLWDHHRAAAAEFEAAAQQSLTPRGRAGLLAQAATAARRAGSSEDAQRLEEQARAILDGEAGVVER